MEQIKDKHGDIRYEKLHGLTLPAIDGAKYYNWLAARMRNYMIFLIRHKEYTSRYYNPVNKGKEILTHHVARYFGVEHCRMLRGFPSYKECWSTRESLFEIGVCTECMPLDAMHDMNRCMHFTDDWMEDNARSGTISTQIPELSRLRLPNIESSFA